MITQNKQTVSPENFLQNKHGLAAIPAIAKDILEVFKKIYIADISTRKRGDVRRTLSVNAMVSNVSLWKQAAPVLKKLIAFVSGDKLNIVFSSVSNQKKMIIIPLFAPNHYDAEGVSLLSGGLDSLCGAYENYRSEISSYYVSYRVKPYDTRAQKDVVENLQLYMDNLLHIHFPRFEYKKVETSQRTRSLMYLALATLTASGYGISRILIYENGIMSLNPSFFGRHTTKSTHPKTLYLYNTLLALLDLQCRIENPFMFYTKGEIIQKLSDDFKDIIKYTTTCGADRRNPYVRNDQCGFCAPCVLRKISLAAYDLEQYDRPHHISYDARLETLSETYHRIQYKSTVDYFSHFKEKIDSDTIWGEIDLSPKYFPGIDNYHEKMKRMFDIFSQEVAVFMDKYKVY